MEETRTVGLTIPATGVLKPKQVAALLGVCVSQVYTMNTEGTLLARFHLFDSEKGLRWHIDDVNDFLESRRTKEYIEAQKIRSMSALTLLQINQEKAAEKRQRYASTRSKG